MLDCECRQDFARTLAFSASRMDLSFVLRAPSPSVRREILCTSRCAAGLNVPRNIMIRRLLRGTLLVFSTLLGCGGLLGSVKLSTGRDLPPAAPNATTENCGMIENDAAWLRCYKQFGATIAQSSTQDGPTAVDMWRLVRTPDPVGGRDAVSITRTADVSKSDLEFAGLMLRCGEGSVQVLIVLVRAFPPRAHPSVKLTAGSATAELTASVVPPEVLLLLPREATSLAAGPWQAATELTVTVEDERGAIRGIVPLTGLGHALALLRSNCPAP